MTQSRLMSSVKSLSAVFAATEYSILQFEDNNLTHQERYSLYINNTTEKREEKSIVYIPCRRFNTEAILG